jgi:hypothetical protein
VAGTTRPPPRLHNLRSYLQARCDTGHSMPRLAHELGESEWTITEALATLGVVLPPRPKRLARQRRRHAQERITKRVAALGFADVRAFLEIGSSTRSGYWPRLPPSLPRIGARCGG